MSAATSQGVIYAERVSAVAEQEQLHLALDFCRAGDVLVVTKLDRLARGVADLCKPALILYGLGRALRYVLSNEQQRPLTHIKALAPDLAKAWSECIDGPVAMVWKASTVHGGGQRAQATPCGAVLQYVPFIPKP